MKYTRGREKRYPQRSAAVTFLELRKCNYFNGVKQSRYYFTSTQCQVHYLPTAEHVTAKTTSTAHSLKHIATYIPHSSIFNKPYIHSKAINPLTSTLLACSCTTSRSRTSPNATYFFSQLLATPRSPILKQVIPIRIPNFSSNIMAFLICNPVVKTCTVG
jgi:hypothetical protein